KLLTVYKIDVQQGNALDAEMIAKVEIGMNKEQVRYVLGSPLITDSFHPNRWDYIYLFTPGYGEQERRQLTLTFDRNEVIDINKHNFVESDVASTTSDNTNENDEKEGKLSEKDQEELEDLEEQADTLRGVLEENKNPGN
ncbi:MAG: outer membrane protein assembly factor BamE, partial [Gammaproteobacteria bacterium]